MNFLLRWLGLESNADVARIVGGEWTTTFQSSPAWLWLVGIVGVALAVLNWMPWISMRTSVRVWTSVLRVAITVVLIAVLAGVEWHVRLELNERQRWTVLVDDSGSMATRDAVGRAGQAGAEGQTVADGGAESGAGRATNVRTRFSAALEDARSIQRRWGDRVDVSIAGFSGRVFDAASDPSSSAGSDSNSIAAGEGPTLFRDVLQREVLSRSRIDHVVLLTDGHDTEGRDLSRVGDELKSRGTRVTVRMYGESGSQTDTSVTAEPDRNRIRLGEDLIVRGALSGRGTGAGNRSGSATNTAATTTASSSTTASSTTAASALDSASASMSEQQLSLKENGKEIKRFTVSAATQWRFETRHVPKTKGQHVYSIELVGGSPSDPLALNDSVRFTVHVVEEKINVLLLEGFPRYEFKLMKGALEVDPLVNLVSVAQLPGGGVYVQGEPLHRNPEQGLVASQADLFLYDVVILRDVARSYFRADGDTSESRLQILTNFAAKRGGGLVVLGGQDVFRAGGYQDSRLVEVLPFDLTDAISAENQFEGLFHVNVHKAAFTHPLMSLLPEADANRERLLGLRQLDGSNNVGRFKPLATPLLTRTMKMKSKTGVPVDVEVPILGYIDVGEGKVVGAAVDTLWRWQLQPEYDDPPFAALMSNLVRYLAPPPGKKAGWPSISQSDGAPQVGQELVLSTDLRDPNYDPIPNADLVVTVTPPSGKSYRMYPRDLPEEAGHYEYRVRLEEPGLYKVAAKHGKNETVREIYAGSSLAELADVSVDRESMKRLTTAAAGKVVAPESTNWLATLDAAPSRKPAFRELEVWNSPFALILFIALVCADCYVRKRQGLV